MGACAKMQEIDAVLAELTRSPQCLHDEVQFSVQEGEEKRLKDYEDELYLTLRLKKEDTLFLK